MPLLQAKALAASHAGKQVFSALDFHLASGEVVALLGPNGCGKTTLLRCLLGLHHDAQGEVSLDGQALRRMTAAQRARIVAYVPQYHRVAFGYRVLDVVLMGRLAGRGMLARTSHADEVRARAVLEDLGMAAYSERAYTELSGGQRQLVLIARALVQDAAFILLDEPVNNLDYGNQLRLLQHIRQLASEQHGILLTTHHPEHALACASRAVLMKQGEVIAQGVTDELLNEAHIRALYDLDENLPLLTSPFAPRAKAQSHPPQPIKKA